MNSTVRIQIQGQHSVRWERDLGHFRLPRRHWHQGTTASAHSWEHHLGLCLDSRPRRCCSWNRGATPS